MVVVFAILSFVLVLALALALALVYTHLNSIVAFSFFRLQSEST